MNINKPEVAAVQAAVVKLEEAIKDLNDLELTLVGGGVGDVVLG